MYHYSPEEIQELPVTMYAVLVNWDFEDMSHVFETVPCNFSVIATDVNGCTKPCIMGYYNGRIQVLDPGHGRVIMMHNTADLDESAMKIAEHLATEWEAAEYAAFTSNKRPSCGDNEEAQYWKENGGSSELLDTRSIKPFFEEKAS